MTTLEDAIKTHGYPPKTGTRVRVNGKARAVQRGEVTEDAEGEIVEYNDIHVKLDDGRVVKVTPKSLDLAS